MKKKKWPLIYIYKRWARLDSLAAWNIVDWPDIRDNSIHNFGVIVDTLIIGQYNLLIVTIIQAFCNYLGLVLGATQSNYMSVLTWN